MAEKNAQSAPSEESDDPNLAGKYPTQGVNREAPRSMTPTDMYDQNEPYHWPKGTE